MLTGINFTSQLLTHLSFTHHPSNWGGTYGDVLPYVIRAYSEVMSEVRAAIDPIVSSEISQAISELCHPDLSRREHRKNVGRPNQYSLERYISQLDFITKEAEIRTRIGKKSA
jgi:eukaryotic-like serine/threonine-protein kinase